MKQWSRATLQEHRSALTAALILLGVILWMLSGTLRDSTSQIEPSVSDKADNRMSVRVLESTNQTIRDQIIISGRTLADRSVAVKAETDGVVQRLHFERG